MTIASAAWFIGGIFLGVTVGLLLFGMLATSRWEEEK